MHIKVNNENMDYDGNCTLEALLKEIGIQADRVAVMINGDVIKTIDIPTAQLAENCCIDILTLAAGG